VDWFMYVMYGFLMIGSEMEERGQFS
jgi:hypothetical protein